MRRKCYIHNIIIHPDKYQEHCDKMHDGSPIMVVILSDPEIHPPHQCNSDCRFDLDEYCNEEYRTGDSRG